MSAPDDSRPRRSIASAFWWTAAVLLGAGASGALLVSQDERLLRLAIVAALWAALIGAFAVAKLAGRLREHRSREAELKRIYTLELQAEVAARKEFELECETSTHQRIQAESGEEIQALRSELYTLRCCLESLAGGAVASEPRGDRRTLNAAAMRVPAEQSRPRMLAAGPSAVNGASYSSATSGGPDIAQAFLRAAENGQSASRQTVHSGQAWQHDEGANDLPSQSSAPATDPELRPQTPAELAHEARRKAALGAHSEGTAVKDLLAAYGDGPQRRRRRPR